jgi:glucoside 3-dehydrogenase (cytochrome c) hitch-hiker subunit
MNRREALSQVALIMGGTIVGAEVILSGCAPKKTAAEIATADAAFTTDNITFLDEVGETILPATPGSPGAKAAKIGEFMHVIVRDCYTDSDQKIFFDGIPKFKDAVEKKYSKDFMDLSDQDKHDFLVALDKEASDYEGAKKDEDPTHYFTMMKQLTLWGFFTSETGSKNALRYNPLPGKWDGSYPYKKGDKAWAAI